MKNDIFGEIKCMKLSTLNPEYLTEGVQLGRLNVEQDWPGSSQRARTRWFVFDGFEMSVWDRSKKAMDNDFQRKKNVTKTTSAFCC